MRNPPKYNTQDIVMLSNKLTFTPALQKAVSSAYSICLTTHINPDGDGLAACLALQTILANMGYASDIVVDDLNLPRFAFLDVFAKVKVNTPDLRYDLVIIVDLHDRQRLGDRAHLADKASQTFIIDHHEVENDLLPVTSSLVEPWAVCTGWMVYELFQEEIVRLNEQDKLYVGTCLYVTLLNDTNNFTNANTDHHAYQLSAELCKLGIKPYQIHRQFMQSRSAQEMRFIGNVLSTIELIDDGKILLMLSTLEMLKANALDADATSNLTRWVTDLKAVDNVVYFREEAPDSYRLSLRSKTKNVHKIALTYGGGGHLVAAGCQINGKLEAIRQKILDQIRNAEAK